MHKCVCKVSVCASMRVSLSVRSRAHVPCDVLLCVCVLTCTRASAYASVCITRAFVCFCVHACTCAWVFMWIGMCVRQCGTLGDLEATFLMCGGGDWKIQKVLDIQGLSIQFGLISSKPKAVACNILYFW